MSSEALGWVYRHSPARGATFAVHLALADSANDQHDYELWMSMTTIGAKARVDPGSARRALAELLACITCGLPTTDDPAGCTNHVGYVELLQAGKGTTNRYRFQFPDVAVIYETRGTPKTAVENGTAMAQEPRAPRATPRAPRATPPRDTRADPAHGARLTQEELKKNPNRTPASFAADDLDAAPIASTEANALLRSGADFERPELDDETRRRNLAELRANRERLHGGPRSEDVAVVDRQPVETAP